MIMMILFAEQVKIAFSFHIFILSSNKERHLSSALVNLVVHLTGLASTKAKLYCEVCCCSFQIQVLISFRTGAALFFLSFDSLKAN